MNFTTAQSKKLNGTPPPLQAALPDMDPLHAGHPVRMRMTVTPELAESWLRKNPANRKLRETVAMRYASDMESGRWKYTYASILISPDGILIDGQHRLAACTLARVPFETDVVFGVDPEIQRYLDGGEARTAGDQCHLAGIKNANQAAAVASLLLIHFNRGVHSMTNAAWRPSRLAIETFVIEHDTEIQTAVKSINRTLCAPRVSGFCSFLFHKQNAAKAALFMEELSSGQNLLNTNPVYHLRERLNNNARSKAKLPPKELIALFFVAWRAYRDGKSMRCLKWRTGDEFPEI